MEVAKAREIVKAQFSNELTYKISELRLIGDRIQLIKLMLHRLRLGILAQHYNVAALCPPEDYSLENIGAQGSWEAFEKAFLESQSRSGSSSDTDKCKNDDYRACSIPFSSAVASPSCANADSQEPSESESGAGSGVDEADPKSADEPECDHHAPAPALPQPAVSRFYAKKRLIVGNTSQFIDPKIRGSDGSTHKWMVYVRGPSGEADVSGFVKSATFFLHPSYHPNDIVKVSRAPFHLTRLGWGEFPVRVQLEFTDPRNKPVDVIHNLVLDRTHTGQQTLGAETVVELDIVAAGVGLGKPAVVPKLPSTENLSSNGGASSSSSGAPALSALANPDCRVKSEPSVVVEGSREPLGVQTVLLPCNIPAEKVLLDHDYCIPVVVMRVRGESLATGSKEAGSSLSQESPESGGTLDRHLHNIVQSLPLYGCVTDDLPMVAPSLEQFKTWNIGRRRALEWMRAVTMKKQLGKRLGMMSITTRQLVEWCRTHGYTPLDPALKDSLGFCKFCGWQLPSMDPAETLGSGLSPHIASPDHHPACKERLNFADNGLVRFSTLSSSYELFGTFRNQEHKKGAKHWEEDEEDEEEEEGEVDVDDTDEQRKMADPSDHLPKFRIPQTPELKWVQQTAGAIGITIYPAVIEKMYAHVVEHMIFMACSRFIKAILTEAMNESMYSGGGASCKERLLLPVHVFSALQSLEFCDFLTNKYLGLPPPPPTTPSSSP